VKRGVDPDEGMSVKRIIPCKAQQHPTREFKERSDMTNAQAQNILEELGHIYAVALAERRHNIDDKSPLMNGLAAYYMLELKGEFKEIDEAVDAICRIVYEEVILKLSQSKE
jgi:hypothetical protein